MNILAIDYSALYTRNWEATDGSHPSVAHDRTLQTVAHIREGYDRVAICCDGAIDDAGPRPSFRYALIQQARESNPTLPGYKHDRPVRPAAFYEQLRRTLQRLQKDGCTVFEAVQIANDAALTYDLPPGEWYSEADDIIASLAAWCVKNGHSLDIFGGDKDLLQCVNDSAKIRVIRPDHDGPWDAARVEADKHVGVSPASVPSWLALGGDKSDGYQAFPKWQDDKGEHPGIGPGHARALLAKYGSISAVTNAIEGVDPNGQPHMKDGAVKEALRHGKPTPSHAVLLGLRLAILDSRLDCGFDRLLPAPVFAPISKPEEARYCDTCEQSIASADIREHFDLGGCTGPARNARPSPAPDPSVVAKEATYDTMSHFNRYARGERLISGDPSATSQGPTSTHAEQYARATVGNALPRSNPTTRDTVIEGEPVERAPSTALARIVPIDRFAMQPRTADEAMRYARWFFDSRVFDGAPNEWAIFVVICDANVLGVPMSTALRNVYWVNGKPAWSAQFVASLVMSSPLMKVFRIIETTTERAVLEYQKAGDTLRTFEFTIEEAKQAQWIKPANGSKQANKWATNPRLMLRYAAIRECARFVCPEVMAGIRVEGDEDYDDERA